MSEANKVNNPMLELLKHHIENTPDFQLKAEFEQLKNSGADSPNAFEYIEALEKYYGNANKAVMWAAKDEFGDIVYGYRLRRQKNNLISEILNNPFVEDGDWERSVYAQNGWQIVQVEVREIVNDKNVSDG